MNKSRNSGKYRVVINGQNFLLNVDGKVPKTGFYTTQFIEAQSAEEAENNAVELIKGDSKLAELVLNERGDSPRLCAEEIEDVKRLEAPLGYAFYSEEEEEN